MHTYADFLHNVNTLHTCKKLTAVGFEPTQLALVELESTPLRPLGQSVLGSRLKKQAGPRAQRLPPCGQMLSMCLQLREALCLRAPKVT